MKAVLRIIILAICFAGSSNASQIVGLESASVDIFDKKSVRRGAAFFANYCMGCHALRQMRYSGIAKDLGIDEASLRREFMFGDVSLQDYVKTGISAKDGEAAFGAPPPDLSLIVRARGADWVFSYLKSFYVDSKRPLGVNNLLAKNISMPNVLWGLQGEQEPVMTQTGGVDTVVGLRHVKKGSMSEEEFDAALNDLVSFLAYSAEPAALQRVPLGKWVLAFIIALTVILYRLKKEYWKDVH